METQTLLILIAIGIGAGILSGFVGVGGGVIIVPALMYAFSMTQYESQGTSLFVLLLPVGILAVRNYWVSGNINWKFGAIIAVSFVLGGYFGSKLALKINPAIVKLVFGVLMAYVAFRMVSSGIKTFNNDY